MLAHARPSAWAAEKGKRIAEVISQALADLLVELAGAAEVP